ncbi:hypothetical protein UFOVP1290_360 [uncultured Caudovirales phage]|uniref:Uncharacterized protein n=1 Tax=uncultured Caudovirales phage TaxID=2100421 RepID=A0A6J5RH69_9CAUD|nr:hypothetical protein UFOVP1290_360 [uncultured Caudovirales phage]
MNSPIIITSKGQVKKINKFWHDLKNTFALINNFKIKPAKFLMNESDYKAILDWQKVTK